MDPAVADAVVRTMRERFPILESLSVGEILEMASREDLAVWSAFKRGYTLAPYQLEWYDIAMFARRAVVLAAREHAKSEIFSVNLATWKSIYTPGHQTYIFCNSGDQGSKILARCVSAIMQVRPSLLEKPKIMHTKAVQLSNDALITVAGSGAAVRGAHPDLIIGDDVQDENNTASQLQRERLVSWWLGTVGGMAHPGTTRVVTEGKTTRVVKFPATRILLVGTPFHSLDLLMSLRNNEMYQWRLFGAISQVHTDDEEDVPEVVSA